ncbi:MAG: hypothetical protein HYZ84_00140 [Candidatus Omnitrophica bacterium]|nr:hypothetical protein [Candidatus Omnitrophota bacterium]
MIPTVRIFIPFILPAMIGILFLFLILRKNPFLSPVAYCTALGLPLGIGLITLVMFWSYVCFNAQAKFSAIALSAILAAALIIWSTFVGNWKKNFSDFLSHEYALPHANFSSQFLSSRLLIVLGMVLFIVAFYDFLRNFAFLSMSNLFGGWDAKTNWNLRAVFLFRSPERWTAIFSDMVLPQLANYPLFLPSAVAWGWNWLNAEPLIWPPLVAMAFTIGIGLMIFWYFSSQNSLFTGLVAASFYWMNPAYRFWATSQYADVPLCFYITAATLTLVTAYRLRTFSLFFLVGLFAGLAAWTKNEGILFSFWILGVTVLLTASIPNHDWKWKSKAILLLIFGLSIPFTAVLYQKLILAPPDIYSGRASKVLELFKSLTNWDKSLFILTALVYSKIGYVEFGKQHYAWNGIWIFFTAALIYVLIFERRRLIQSGLWAILTLVLVIDIGYFLVFHLSPFDLRFHLSTSMHRLALHHGILALIFSFEVFLIRGKDRVSNPAQTLPE